MFIIYSIILGIILGLLRGGKFGNLTNHPLNYKLLAAASFLLQILIFTSIPVLKPLTDALTVPLHILSYLLLLLFIGINFKVPGILVLGAGILLNSLTIFLNGGYMPSSLQRLAAVENNIHNNVAQIDKGTLLPWLGDIFHLPSWLPFTNAFSIGDILIAVGVCIYLMMNMKSARA